MTVVIVTVVIVIVILTVVIVIVVIVIVVIVTVAIVTEAIVTVILVTVVITTVVIVTVAKVTVVTVVSDGSNSDSSKGDSSNSDSSNSDGSNGDISNSDSRDISNSGSSNGHSSRRTATPATPWWPAIPRPSTSSPTGNTTTTRSDGKLVFPRNKFPKLEQKNIQFWFKNRRAKCKRINNVGNFLSDTPQDPTNLLKIGQNSSTILLHHDRTPPVVTSAPHLHSIVNPNLPSSPPLF